MVKFFYNDRGQRVRKENFVQSQGVWVKTYYVRDAVGSVMAVYTKRASDPLLLTEHPVYGAERLGIFYRNTSTYAYQLTDHLGNVRAVVVDAGGTAVSITSKTDYYPFGMAMPGRHVDGGYRYAYQGQEKDDETGMEAFELRLWDARIGRWLTVDPYNEFFSPYLGMGNNPVLLIDPDGGNTECLDCPNNSFLNFSELQNFEHIRSFGNVTANDYNSQQNQNFVQMFMDDIFSFTTTIAKYDAEIKFNLKKHEQRIPNRIYKINTVTLNKTYAKPFNNSDGGHLLGGKLIRGFRGHYDINGVADNVFIVYVAGLKIDNMIFNGPNTIYNPFSTSDGSGWPITFEYKGRFVGGMFFTSEDIRNQVVNQLYHQRVKKYYEGPNGSGSFEYVYQYKDHLGNVRLTYSDLDGNGAISSTTEILQERNYYPFGSVHQGYNNKIVGVENNHKTFQGQEISKELGYNMFEFKFRHYDPAIGRFAQIDPLAEDYVHNSTYAFAENKVISHLELEGLEGIHFSKVDAAGNRTHTIRKNVAVLTRAPRPVNEGASPRKAARIQRQNARIKAANIAKVKDVKTQLNNQFGNAKNSAGETVNFEFNVTGMEVENTKTLGSRAEQTKVAVKNGIEGVPAFDGGDNQVAPAAIITTQPTGQSQTNGLEVQTDDTEGALSHEVGHTLMTRGKNQEEGRPGSGGLMVDPPGHIKASEVDKMIEDAIPALPSGNN